MQSSYIKSIDAPLLETTGDFCLDGPITSLNLPKLKTTGVNCLFNMHMSKVTLPLLETIGDNSISNVIYNAYPLEEIDFPNLKTIGAQCFGSLGTLTKISIPSCTNLGGTVGYDYLFLDYTEEPVSRTIYLTVPSALMTCNGGNPDGDIQNLQLTNTVIITEV